MAWCSQIMFLLVVSLLGTPAFAEEGVPPKTAGLWEFKSEIPQFTLAYADRSNPSNKSKLEIKSHMTTQISRRCIIQGDPTPPMSAETSNMLAKFTTCWGRTVTQSGNTYTVQQNCQTASGSSIQKTIYTGDFNRHVSIESIEIIDNQEKPSFKIAMTRIGNCPNPK